MPLNEITGKDIKDFLPQKQTEWFGTGKKKKRLSAGTVQNLKAYLSAIYLRIFCINYPGPVNSK